MTMPASSPDTTEELVALLVQLAHAQGCALYEARHGNPDLVRRAVAGVAPPELPELVYYDLDWLKRQERWAALPLYRDGLLVSLMILTFSSEAEREAARVPLRKIAPLFKTLVQFANARERQIKLAVHISELETEIASEKILERARGLLKEHADFNEATIELVDRHVAKVLASCQFDKVLQERLHELESRAAERDLTTRAKLALQQKFGLSEERAYMQLRTISRQRRKRIHEIAQEILDDPGETWLSNQNVKQPLAT